MTQIPINSKIVLKKRFNAFQFMELLDISYERLIYPIIEVLINRLTLCKYNTITKNLQLILKNFAFLVSDTKNTYIKLSINDKY